MKGQKDPNPMKGQKDPNPNPPRSPERRMVRPRRAVFELEEDRHVVTGPVSGQAIELGRPVEDRIVPVQRNEGTVYAGDPPVDPTRPCRGLRYVAESIRPFVPCPKPAIRDHLFCATCDKHQARQFALMLLLGPRWKDRVDEVVGMIHGLHASVGGASLAKNQGRRYLLRIHPAILEYLDVEDVPNDQPFYVDAPRASRPVQVLRPLASLQTVARKMGAFPAPITTFEESAVEAAIERREQGGAGGWGGKEARRGGASPGSLGAVGTRMFQSETGRTRANPHRGKVFERGGALQGGKGSDPSKALVEGAHKGDLAASKLVGRLDRERMAEDDVEVGDLGGFGGGFAGADVEVGARGSKKQITPKSPR